MPNPYTMHRMKRKAQGQKRSVTSQKVRVGSGGRRVRVVGTEPIEKAKAIGTEPIKSDVQELSRDTESATEQAETEKKKSEKKRKK